MIVQKPLLKIRRQAGFTLIEVLVTMLVLSIGLLGLAGLQAYGLGANREAYLRSQATVLAYDMADRMRANREGINNLYYDNPTAAAVSACTNTTGCDAAQMAQNDMHEWDQMLAERLPSGAGVICVDNSPDDGTPTSPQCDGTGSYSIKIWWREDPGNASLQRFVTNFQP